MKESVLTHEEACVLVEDAIERCAKTLAYIRLKLECRKPNPKTDVQLSLFEQNTVEQANLLCNINWYGAYLKGAQAMALALKEWNLMDFPQQKIGSGNYKGTAKRENPIVNKAVFDLFLSSTRNMEYCMQGLPNNVEIRFHTEKDKKGKVVKATAKFVKKETKYKEI